MPSTPVATAPPASPPSFVNIIGECTGCLTPPSAGVAPLVAIGHAGTRSVAWVNACAVVVVCEGKSGEFKVTWTVPCIGGAVGTPIAGSGSSGVVTAASAHKGEVFKASEGPGPGVVPSVTPTCAGGGTPIKVVDAGVDSAGKAE